MSPPTIRETARVLRAITADKQFHLLSAGLDHRVMHLLQHIEWLHPSAKDDTEAEERIDELESA